MTDQSGSASAPWWVTSFTPLAKTLLGAGVPLGFNGLITIRGRKTGIPRTTPVAIIEVSGRRWVWAPWGDVHWVRNLRAAGRATITVRKQAEGVRATELTREQRLEFFRDVLGPLARGIPGGVSFIRIADQVDLNRPEAAADGRPVFELHPIPEENSPWARSKQAQRCPSTASSPVPNDSGFDLLFKWYGAGDVEVPMPDDTAGVPASHVSAATAELLKKEMGSWGALVVGRHLYDLVNGWNGRHPLDVTTVVLTHRPPDDRPRADENFVFVTDGIEAAVAKAKEIAGDKDVAVNSGQMARQALEAGLLDEIGVDVVPVILGEGTPFFADLTTGPQEFEGPILTVQGKGVTHLRYRVTGRA